MSTAAQRRSQTVALRVAEIGRRTSGEDETKWAPPAGHAPAALALRGAGEEEGEEEEDDDDYDDEEEDDEQENGGRGLLGVAAFARQRWVRAVDLVEGVRRDLRAGDRLVCLSVNKPEPFRKFDFHAETPSRRRPSPLLR